MDSRTRTPRAHDSRIVASPVPGVYSTYTNSGRQFGKHWHDVYGFGLLYDGAQSWRSGRGVVAAYPGQVISTNPGEVHDGRPLGASTREWRIVSVSPHAMASFVGLETGTFEIAQPVVDDPELATLLARLFAALDGIGDGVATPGTTRLASEEALSAACTRLIARHGSRRVALGTPRTDLQRVRDRLIDDNRDTPRLEELARIARLSKFQVLRRFERQFGLPPHAWLLHHRAERARTLIHAGKSLADAATISGFADQSHMTRVFVRHFGYTPGAWKRAVCH